jgi:uncharacterized protein DUF3108
MKFRLHSRSSRRFQPASPARLAIPLAVVLAGFAALGAAPETDSGSTTSSATVPAPGGRDVLPAVDHPFGPGESLRFTVQYGVIHAGSAWLEVSEGHPWQGHDVLTFRARAESNGFFSRFYRVRNVIASTWDERGHYSWHYEEDRHEGGKRSRSAIAFDHAHHEALYQDGTRVPIPPQVQDALSSFYYTRLQALPVGGSVVFDYHASKKSQPLQVKVLGRERVSVPAGNFACVVIEPVLRAGGIFRNNGRLQIWLTDDERRMPVMMKSKVSVGSISVVLTDARKGV